MAAPANLYVSSSAVGIKESVVDDVFVVSPVDTKFTGKIKSGKKPTSTKHEWLTDTIPADTDNAQPEGNTVTISATTAATRLYNILQIQDKKFGVSRTTLELQSYGGVTEEGRLTALNMKALAKDSERAALRAVRNDTDTRQMRGALNWTITNLSKDAGATLNADGTVTGGSLRPFTEGIFKDVVENIFNNSTGTPDTVYTTTSLSRKFTEFGQTGTYRQMVKKGELDSYVDVYATEFDFVFKVTPHRLMPANTMFICDHDTWKKNVLHPATKKELGYVADGKQLHIVTEWTIEARSELCNGRITQIF
jgi:hypothetical protein